jgi:hypothetical protein
LLIASRPSGAMMAIFRSGRAGTSVDACASCMAPGWKAVIWLLSVSVMMIACAV